jgi:hypothetical protein
MRFLQDNDNANKKMLDVLHTHRYDLSDNSYVNKKIKAFNSKLKKIAGIFFIVLQFCNSIVIETFSLSKV